MDMSSRAILVTSGSCVLFIEHMNFFHKHILFEQIADNVSCVRLHSVVRLHKVEDVESHSCFQGHS